MNRHHMHRIGLKWNPFAANLPLDGFHVADRVETFCSQVRKTVIPYGGFACITGDTGTGKSATLRLLDSRIRRNDNIVCRALTHPSSRITDFYREMGTLFGITLAYNNRWNGFSRLRETWLAHIESHGFLPVLIIDEAQELHNSVFSELRLLASADFDSRAILSVIFAGDSRLLARLRSDDQLRPIASRLRVVLGLDELKEPDMSRHLEVILEKAGKPDLMSADLKRTLVRAAQGNLRNLANLGLPLITEAIGREMTTIDEKLWFELHG